MRSKNNTSGQFYKLEDCMHTKMLVYGGRTKYCSQYNFRKMLLIRDNRIMK